MDIIKEIDQIIQEKSLLKHPFYEMWSAGQLTMGSLAGYSKEYFQLVKAVPAYMDQIIQQAPQEFMRELVENRTEEYDHIAPWVRFADALGIPESELKDYCGLEKTVRAVHDLSDLMGTFEGGACAMYALEKELPLISQTKLDGLDEFYGINDKEATLYFELHTEADIRHAALWRGIVENSATNPQSLVRIAEESVGAQNLLLDSCYEGYVSGTGCLTQD